MSIAYRSLLTTLNQGIALPLANIVSLWKGEDNAVDSIGSNNGTPNLVTYDPAIIGKGINYNGSTAAKLTLAHHASLNIGNQPWTMSLLFYREFSGNVNTWLQKGTLVNNPREYSIGHFEIELKDTANVGSLKATSNVNATYHTNNTWRHYVYTSDGSGTFEGLKIYVDGVDFGTTNNSTGTFVSVVNTTETATIGHRATGSAGAYSVRGIIDEQKLWNVTLTPEQAMELATLELAGIDILA